MPIYKVSHMAATYKKGGLNIKNEYTLFLFMTIQNGFNVIYQETKNNPLAPFKSFTIKTKNKNSAIEYAAKFANFNHFKIIEIKPNF